MLGLAEAGFFPGIVWFLGRWFPERERARAMSWFMIGIPLAGAIGGPVGGALLSLDGRLGLAGWRWLFLLEGAPPILLGLVALRYLTDSPEKADWLTKEQRRWLVDEMQRERVAGAGARRADVRRALFSGVTWWLSLLYLFALSAELGPDLLRPDPGA